MRERREHRAEHPADLSADPSGAIIAPPRRASGAASKTDRPVLAAARRICFFAHYDPDGLVADHVLFQLAGLRAAGFAIAAASTARLDADQHARLAAACDALILRENVGMDFGGWQDLHALLPGVAPDLLLLCNDSVYGPLGDLGAFLDRLTATPADLYGLVGSLQGRTHAQSWFVLLRPAAYRSAPYRVLMAERIAADMDKSAIIRRFETGLSADLAAAGLRIHLAYDPARDGAIQPRSPFNAAHVLWRQLVEADMAPFVKVELLRDNPMLIPDVAAWRDVVGLRAPALVPMIEADLARRSRPRPVKLAERTRRAMDAPPSALNFLRPLLLADFRLTLAGRRRAARVLATMFDAAGWGFRLARGPVNRLRRRRG